MLVSPLSTYTREVYDIRSGWDVFSLKQEHPNLEMIGSLRLTPHGYLPLVYVRGAGVPALGEDGRPFVYRLRHIDLERQNFDGDLQRAIFHLASLMDARAHDVPLRDDLAQQKAVQALCAWTASLTLKAGIQTTPAPLPRTDPLQTYTVETYNKLQGELVYTSIGHHLNLECRLLETTRGFLPATSITSHSEHVMTPPGSDSSLVYAFNSLDHNPLFPTTFYAYPDLYLAAHDALQELQRASRSIWHTSDATEAEITSVYAARALMNTLDPVAVAQEFVSQLTGPAEIPAL